MRILGREDAAAFAALDADIFGVEAWPPGIIEEQLVYDRIVAVGIDERDLLDSHVQQDGRQTEDDGRHGHHDRRRDQVDGGDDQVGRHENQVDGRHGKLDRMDNADRGASRNGQGTGRAGDTPPGRGRLAAAGMLGLGIEAELLTISVRPEHRRKGLASQIITELLRLADGAEACFLEVRASDDGARSLYEGLGFYEVGRRRGYYRDEDAVVMRKDFGKPDIS